MINLSFLAEITLQWSLWLGLYFILFRHRTFFGLNRFYLLATIVLGIIFPLLHTYAPISSSSGFVFSLPEILVTPNRSTVQSTPIIPATNWVPTLYYSGVLIFSGIFILNMTKIFYTIWRSDKHKQGNYWIVELPQKTAPFSFLNFIFVFRKEAYAKEEWDQILLHEQTHSRLLHSLDILLIEILKIVFWWNPLIYFYKIALRDVHEYQADSATTKKHNKKEYSRLLFRHTQSGMQVPLTSNFISSQLKKRIKMLTIKRSNPDAKFRYLLAFPLLALLFFVSCQSDAKEIAKAANEARTKEIKKEIKDLAESTKGMEMTPENKEAFTEKAKIIATELREIKQNEAPEGVQTQPALSEQDIYKTIAVMPKYEGCNGPAGNGQLDKCSERAFLKDIYQNVQYPQEAKDAGIEGRVVIKFIINTSGKMEGIKVLRGPGESLNAEALRVLNKINNSKTWIPGRVEGKDVKVQYILPLNFQLE